MDEEEMSRELEANRKPGQRYPTPSPGFADRVFYESLLQQRSDSLMAKKWCVEYGILEWETAEIICKELNISTKGISIKASPTKLKMKGSKSSKKSQIINDVGDTGFQSAGVYEGIGSREM